MPSLLHSPMHHNKYELLAPAGDMERLEMALHYGADAVYLAGKEFGMRAAAGNFSVEEMQDAVRTAHTENVKVYVTVNTIPREDEISRLESYLKELDRIGVDGLIIADLGVLDYANRFSPNTHKHVSTQLGVLNSATAKVLYNMGADRIVLARETPMEDIRKIRESIPPSMEIEAFVHGAMCVSFSGRCLLSNYLADRDANRGQCAQPCRWKYHLVEETRPGEYYEITEDNGTFILNSKDMCMIEHIPELLDAGVMSLKIEGRMKSAYYAAVVTNAYRHALDCAIDGIEKLPQVWLDEMEMVSHRPYSTGFYFGYPGQHYSESSYFAKADVCGVVESCEDDGWALISQRNKFSPGDILDVLSAEGEPIRFAADKILDEEGNELESANHAMMKVRIQLPQKCEPLSLIRKMKSL